MGLHIFKKRKSSADNPVLTEPNSILCSNLSFAASEAYKLLRTNLTFTLTSERNCRIIGITSASRGEGKSTTSINLSYTIAEAGYRTLLIEADMRLPIIGGRLNLDNQSGLSNVLAGQLSPFEPIQTPTLFPFKNGSTNNWQVLLAGSIPPNPSDLLSSSAMKKIMDAYAERYDYIIIDLPPVTIVSDALVVSPLTDGIVMVVRQDYADKPSVRDAIRQFQFSNARLLGFVLTCAGTITKRYRRYGKYRRYGRYYKRYGKYYNSDYNYGYDYGYGHDHGKSKDSTDDNKK